MQLAGVKVKLNQLRDEMEECVSKQEFSRAAELKQMISGLEEERDSLTQDEGLNLQVVREEKVMNALVIRTFVVEVLHSAPFPIPLFTLGVR